MRSFFRAGLAVGALLAACSSASSRPGNLGNCTGDDSGACTNGGSGGSGSSGSGGSGSSSGSEGDGGACTADPSTSQCQQCVVSGVCCGDLDTCAQSTTCQNLLGCVSHCATQVSPQACVNTCEQTYLSASSTYKALTSCMSLHCPICFESGVGDPCGATADPCVSGTSCSGLWCTRTCTKASDCAGIGPGGGNFTGNPSACRHYGAYDYCYPGCSGDGDCSTFPGTYCITTTDLTGASVQVCASSPDAGTD